mgnify:CR=1 FL=1
MERWRDGALGRWGTAMLDGAPMPQFSSAPTLQRASEFTNDEASYVRKAHQRQRLMGVLCVSAVMFCPLYSAIAFTVNAV